MADTDRPIDLATDLDGCFVQVVEAYQHRLFAFALRLTGDRSDAEEIVQDAFVRAYRALTTYPAEQRRTLALRPWLYQITLNVARNRHRVRRLATTSLVTTTGELVIEPPAGPGTDPEAVALASERRAALARCLLTVPLHYRAALILRHVEGLPYADVATALGIPVGTAKANVHRGARLLRQALVGADLTPADRGRAQSLPPEEATA